MRNTNICNAAFFQTCCYLVWPLRPALTVSPHTVSSERMSVVGLIDEDVHHSGELHRGSIQLCVGLRADDGLPPTPGRAAQLVSQLPVQSVLTSLPAACSNIWKLACTSMQTHIHPTPPCKADKSI